MIAHFKGNSNWSGVTESFFWIFFMKIEKNLKNSFFEKNIDFFTIFRQKMTHNFFAIQKLKKSFQILSPHSVSYYLSFKVCMKYMWWKLRKWEPGNFLVFGDFSVFEKIAFKVGEVVQDPISVTLWPKSTYEVLF